MTWTCKECTFDNATSLQKCEMCENDRKGTLENIDIEKKLLEINLKIKIIKGDGNCLYECFVKSGKCPDQKHLRNLVASELDTFKENYKKFISNGTFEERVLGIRNNAYGDHLEIQIISNIFGLHIIIYHNNSNTETHIVPKTEIQTLNYNNKIHLLYSGDHYNLIVPIETELFENKNGALKIPEDTSKDELMSLLLQITSILSK